MTDFGLGETPRETRTDHLVNTLRRHIVLGDFPPGMHLRIDALADKLAVSRVPLREALRQLHAEGLVVAYPQRGVIVSGIDKNDVIDSFYMLKTVETVAAERSVRENYVATGALMAERYAHLQTVLDSTSDKGDYLTAHKNFHFSVFAQSQRSTALERSTGVLWHSCERFIYAAQAGERIKQSDYEHQWLVTAMSEGDVSAVRAITMMHVEHAAEAALKGLGFD